jgi:hypothetical protein
MDHPQRRRLPFDNKCKLVINRCFKGNGMRWKRPGNERILEVRLAILMKLWSKLLNLLIKIITLHHVFVVMSRLDISHSHSRQISLRHHGKILLRQMTLGHLFISPFIVCDIRDSTFNIQGKFFHRDVIVTIKIRITGQPL